MYGRRCTVAVDDATVTFIVARLGSDRYTWVHINSINFRVYTLVACLGAVDSWPPAGRQP